MMLLEQILFHAPCPVFWKNTEGAFLGCNKAFLKILGMQNYSDLIGKKDPELPWKNCSEEYAKDDQYVIKTGKTITTVENIPIGDRIVISETTKSPLIQDGKIIGVLGIALDITAQKEAEALRLKEIVNEEKMETIRLLAASIAHEIRTPLATINAQSNIIKSILPILLETYHNALDAGQVKQPLRTSQLELLAHLPEELNQTTASANTFIDMLLTKVNFEDLKEKKMPLQTISIKNAVMEAIHLYPLDEYSAELLHYDCKKTFDFMGDEILFRHIIFNLLKNAIYFVRSKGTGGSIKIWCEQKKESNILHFKDSGIGVSAENLPNIFHSFYTNTRHGTGVGLAFCKMIIESFGGTISCDSIEGEYTHFMLKFPKI